MDKQKRQPKVAFWPQKTGCLWEIFVRRKRAAVSNFRVGAGIARPPEAVPILQTVSYVRMIKFAPAVGSRRAVTGRAFSMIANAPRFTKMPGKFAGSCTRAGNARPYAVCAFRGCVPAGRCGHRPLRRDFGDAFCGRALPAPTRCFRILKIPARGHGAPWPYGAAIVDDASHIVLRYHRPLRMECWRAARLRTGL